MNARREEWAEERHQAKLESYRQQAMAEHQLDNLRLIECPLEKIDWEEAELQATETPEETDYRHTKRRLEAEHIKTLTEMNARNAKEEYDLHEDLLSQRARTNPTNYLED